MRKFKMGKGSDGSTRQETLLKELNKEREILESVGTCPRSLKLLKNEIDRIRHGRRDPPKAIEVTKEMAIHLHVRVKVPVKEHPRFNFVGKLMGPKGNSLRRLQEETMTKMAVGGRGSMRDKNKEEELRTSDDPKFQHLKEDLHVDVVAVAPPAEAYARIALALSEVSKYLTPDKNDAISQAQMKEMEMLQNDKNLNGTADLGALTGPILDDGISASPPPIDPGCDQKGVPMTLHSPLSPCGSEASPSSSISSSSRLSPISSVLKSGTTSILANLTNRRRSMSQTTAVSLANARPKAIALFDKPRQQQIDFPAPPLAAPAPVAAPLRELTIPSPFSFPASAGSLGPFSAFSSPGIFGDLPPSADAYPELFTLPFCFGRGPIKATTAARIQHRPHPYRSAPF